MKKTFLITCALVFALTASYVSADMGGEKGQEEHGMMGEGMMPVMGQGILMQDMMHMMMDMMKMQKKMLKGVTPAEKKEMMTDMDKMMDRMERMMSDMRGMMMKEMTGPAPAEPKNEATKTDQHKH